MSLVQTTLMLTSVVTDVKQAASGVAGVLNGTKMVLFTNQFQPDVTTVLADLVLPVDANLAAPQALTWGAAHRDTDGRIVTETGLTAWVPVNGANPTTVYGYGIVNAAANALIAAEVLPEPAIMTDALSYLGIISRWTPNNDDPGTCTQIG